MNTSAEAEIQTQVFIETLRRVDTEIESAIELLKRPETFPAGRLRRKVIV